MGDAARAGTKGAGSEQHMPGQVTLCHLQWKVLGWAAGGVALSSLTTLSLAGSGCFGRGLLLTAGPCHPLPPYSPPKTIPILAAAGHRERFLPSLPLLLFPSHSHSLSMNPLCCISSITFLSPSCSLLMGCPAPSIPSPQLVSPPSLHQPLSCRIFILSLSFSCCPWHHRQGQVLVPEG